MRNAAQQDVKKFVGQVRKMTQGVRANLASLSKTKNPLATVSRNMNQSLKTVTTASRRAAQAVQTSNGRIARSAASAGQAVNAAGKAYQSMAQNAQQAAQKVIANHNKLIASLNRLRASYNNPITTRVQRPANQNTTAARGNNSGAANAASVRQTTANLSNGIEDAKTAVAQFISAASLGALLRELQQYADTWTSLGNKIAAVGVPLADVPSTLKDIADIARRSRNSIEDVGGTFARLTIASQEIGASQAQVARVTETLSKSMTIAGASTQEAQAALIQFGQALASGVLQGDELRSIRENAPLVAKAIADEFGITIGQLKEYGAEGKITADRVFAAIYKASASVDAAFNKTQITIGNAFTNLRTSLTQFIGEIDKAYGVSASIANALNTISTAIANGDRGFKALAASAAVFMTVVGGGSVFILTAKAISSLGGPLVKATLAVAGLAAAIAVLAGAFVYFQGTVITANGITGTFGSQVQSYMTVTAQYVTEAATVVGSAIESLWQWVSDKGIAAARLFEETWRAVVANVRGFFGYMADGIKDTFSEMVDSLVRQLDRLITNVLPAYNAVAEVLGKRTIDPNVTRFSGAMLSIGEQRAIDARQRRSLSDYVDQAKIEYDRLREQEEKARAALREALNSAPEGDGFMARVAKLTKELDVAKAKADALRRAMEMDRRGDKGSRDEAAELRLKATPQPDGKAEKTRAREIERANDQLRSHVLQLQQEQQLLGLVGRERERVQQLMQFENQLMGMENLTQEERNNLLREYNTALVDHMSRLQQYRTATNGAREAATEYALEAGNAFENAKTFMSNTLSSLEDSLANFFTIGKGGWKEMIQSMISDFLRLLVIRPLMAKVLGAMGLGDEPGTKTSFFAGAANAIKGIPNGAATGVGSAGNVQPVANVAAATAVQTVKSLKTDIVADVLRAGSGGAGGALSFGGNYKAGVDPKLMSILGDAASKSDYAVKVISGFRPGDKRFHGQGMAADVQLTDRATGRVLNNYQNGADFRAYEQFAQQARQSQMAMYPELTDKFRWGGYFSGGKGKYGALDTMHFDTAGGRVGMGGGSWAGGLNFAQRAYFPDAQSVGMGGMANNAAVQAIQQQTAALQTIQQNTAQANTIGQQQLSGIQQSAQQVQGAAGAMQVQQMNVSSMTGANGGSPIAGAVQQAAPKIQSSVGGAFQNVAATTQGTFGAIFQSLGGAFQNIFGSVFQGLGGIFQSIFSGLGGKGGGGGGLGSILGIIASIAGFHKGGIVGSTGRSGGSIQRHVSAVGWAGAPKYHDGGIVGGLKSGERRAVLKDGEAVMPTVRLPDGSFGVKALGGGEGGGSGGSMTFAPVTQVTLQGASGSAEEQKALGDQLAAKVNDMMDAKMNEFMAKQMRSGGTLNRYGFN